MCEGGLTHDTTRQSSVALEVIKTVMVFIGELFNEER
jgi:hypothetical protein